MKKNFNFSLVVFIFLLFVACNKEEEGEILLPIFPTPQSINYLALGDSYTIGQGVDESERWPNQLREKLIENDYLLGKTEIIAQTGWTTNNLLSAIATADPEDCNLVSLLIGVNNQFQSQPFNIFETEFNSLLNISIDLAGAKENVFVLSIPDYGVTPFGSNNSQMIGADIDRYNDYIRQRCETEDILFVDITEISRILGDSSGALASDNLHPSGSQYAAWVEAVLPELMALLMG